MAHPVAGSAGPAIAFGRFSDFHGQLGQRANQRCAQTPAAVRPATASVTATAPDADVGKIPSALRSAPATRPPASSTDRPAEIIDAQLNHRHPLQTTHDLQPSQSIVISNDAMSHFLAYQSKERRAITIPAFKPHSNRDFPSGRG